MKRIWVVRGQTQHRDGMRQGKLFHNEGYAYHWHMLYSSRVPKFPRQGELRSAVCGTDLNDISFSLHNLSIIPMGWGVRRIPVNHTHFEYLRQRDFFFFVFMIKHPNIYPSGITSLGWIQETLVTRTISHHKSPNKLSFSLPLLICRGAQPSGLESSPFWQGLQFQDDGAILFHIHHYYF